MDWREMIASDKERAAQLIGMVDAGERWIFEHPEKNPDLERVVCKMVCAGDGALHMCVYAGKLHGAIAFKDDLPMQSAAQTEVLIKDLIMREKREAVLCVRHENVRLRSVVEAAFGEKADYEAREMSVSKAEFACWKAPQCPADMKIAGYDSALLTAYLALLDRAMAHVIAPGTTPFQDKRAYYADEFPIYASENRFHALWAGNALAGVCYSWGGELSILALDAPHRRRGAGYALLHAGLAGAFGNRDGDICLYVVDSNPNALAFYRHIGMRETGHCALYRLACP